MTGPTFGPAVEAAKGRASKALGEAVESVRALTAMLAEEGRAARHDDVADLLQIAERVAGDARTIRAAVEGLVLGWLLDNAEGHRRVVVGDLAYYGEREKQQRCVDHVAAGLAVFRQMYAHHLLALLAGDEDAEEQVAGMVRGFLADAVSTSGLRPGACRKALGEVAFAEHWTEQWPDRLAHGEAEKATKLGVAQLRFIHRRGAASKAELAALDAASRGGDTA